MVMVVVEGSQGVSDGGGVVFFEVGLVGRGVNSQRC